MKIDYMSCNPDILNEGSKKVSGILEIIDDIVRVTDSSIKIFLQNDWTGIERDIFESEYALLIMQYQPLINFINSLKQRMDAFAEKVDVNDKTYANKFSNY